MPRTLPPGRWGAKEIEFRQFLGLCEGEDTSPTELPDTLAAAALNVDFTGESLRTRKGRTAYNAAAPNGPVTGLHLYYPTDGSAGIPVMAAGSSVWADVDHSRTFAGAEEIRSHLTGGRMTDITQFKNRVYGCNGVDVPWRWSGSGAAATAANPTAPTGFSVARAFSLLENFDDDSAWVLVGTHLSFSDLSYSGVTVLNVAASSSSAEGEYAHKVWSAGATVDLSPYDSVAFNAISPSGAGNVLRFGVKKNDGTLVWVGFFTLEQANVWEEVVMDLTAIDPADRTASTGFAIGWTALGAGLAYPLSVLFEDAYAVAPLIADHYVYYATYVDPLLGYESAPSAIAEVTLPAGHQSSALTVTVDQTSQTGITEIHLWRHHDDASFARPIRIAVLTNTPGGGATTFSDDTSDSQALIDGQPFLTTQYQIDPPVCRCLARVGGRVHYGAPTIGGVFHPSRFYVSRYGFPEGLTSSQDPDDPTAGGYFDLSEADTLLRIVEVDGNSVLFCERSIWTLEGDGWDNWRMQKRASVGLSAPQAVAAYGRLVLFLAEDGVRALECAFGSTSIPFRTWVVSESVDKRLREIPSAYRGNASAGIDERSRFHLSYTAPGASQNDAAVVLDLRAPGALSPPPDRFRPGWTAYDHWGFSCFETRKRGGGDYGQLLAGDPETGRLWELQLATDGSDLTDDSDLPIEWEWTSAAVDHGRRLPGRLGYLAADLEPQPGAEVTLAAVLDREDGEPVEKVKSLGAKATGRIPLLVRTAARQFAVVQVRVSGNSLAPVVVRSAVVGVYA